MGERPLNKEGISSKEHLEYFYLKLVELWKKFCEHHSDLFSITCDEYSALLINDINKVEEILKIKDEKIEQIKKLEATRRQIINEINLELLPEKKIDTVSKLLKVMFEFEESNRDHFLEKYNAILIDIIVKIQNQNKKNQLFLNKSLISLREIREGLLGKKNYFTYTAQGMSKNF